jgi:outer membrane translocation and assembly module TamA
VSSNLSDDDGGWSGAKRDFVADCRDKMADGRDAIADTREAPADMREEEHDRRERERARADALGLPPEQSETVVEREASRAARVDARQERGAEGQIRPSDRERRDEAAQRHLDDGGPTLLALAFAPARRLDSMTPTRTTTSSP